MVEHNHTFNFAGAEVIAQDPTKGGHLLKEAWLSDQHSINRHVDLPSAYQELKQHEQTCRGLEWVNRRPPRTRAITQNGEMEDPGHTPMEIPARLEAMAIRDMKEWTGPTTRSRRQRTCRINTTNTAERTPIKTITQHTDSKRNQGSGGRDYAAMPDSWLLRNKQAQLANPGGRRQNRESEVDVGQYN